MILASVKAGAFYIAEIRHNDIYIKNILKLVKQ